MLTLLAIYLNSSKLITGIISGLLTKFHGEIKKIMAKNVLVGATQLDASDNNVSLWTKLDRFSSMMTALIPKDPVKRRFQEPWTSPKFRIFVFTPLSQ